MTNATNTADTSEAVPAYLIPTSLLHCSEHMTVPISYVSLPDANVLAILKEDNYILAKITPPLTLATCYMYSRGDVIAVTVQQLYALIQSPDCICWCEL